MKPRPQEKNQMVQICRNTEEQRRFLGAEEEMKNLLGYCLGLALKETRVELNVGQFTLDRAELTAFDADRERSDFMRILFGYSGRAINVRMGRSNARVWGPRDHDGATPILDRDTVIEAMAETLASPAVQGLVDRHQDWPGLSFGPEDWGKTFVFTRPDFYFSDGMPETVEVTPVPPPGFEDEGESALREALRREVNRLEKLARAERKARGETVLGLKALRRVTRGAFAKRPPKRARRLHYRTSDRGLAARAGEALRRFLRRHEEARQEMLRRRPDRDFLFPPETYWWRERSDAPCAALRDRQIYDPP